ncbi:hypothetical protein VTL71DRAFT_3800 [Oculimacula yallundae]|uniref:Heterokaryon incompatibility domain-containing protein n=1 Tax=Oculimacula yallundae TaxID=86028 RepID=A0ABR4C4Q2_9HELO
MEVTEDKYTYKPLSDPRDIRVLVLTDDCYSRDTMTFTVNLRVVNLNDFQRPIYHALSYAWNLPEIEEDEVALRPSRISIRIGDASLDIGENLFDFLYQLVHLPDNITDDSEETLLWIDAICINQEDMEEKSSQVGMMQEIYKKAEGTLIWLGRQDKNSLKAITLIKQLSKTTGSLPATRTYGLGFSHGNFHDEEFFSSNGITPLTQADWRSISLFFSRSWFHRVWTIQELVMGKIWSKMVLCGETLLDVDDIVDFIELAMVKGWIMTLRTLEFNRTRKRNVGATLGIEVSLSMGAVYKATSQNPLSGLFQHVFGYRDEDSFICAKFAWLLNFCRQKKVTDERDRVFATSGMVSEYRKPVDWHLLGPDYSKSAEEVFTNASKFIIQALGNLSWLSFVEDKSLRIHKSLPSWVPDLAAISGPAFLAGAGSFDVYRNCEGKIKFRNHLMTFVFDALHPDFTAVSKPPGPSFLPNDSSLSVKGHKLDKLAFTTHDLNEIFLEHRISSMVVAASRFPTYAGDMWLVALMKTMAVNTSSDLDTDSGSLVLQPSQNFEKLWEPFLHFLKLEIAQEIYSWTRWRAISTKTWWEEHPDFARLCNSCELFPSREDFEAFSSVFTALYPCQQNAQTNPMIEDEDYLEVLHKPGVPYTIRCAMSCGFRALVQTECARMGLAPLSAKPDDEIWILEGAKIPFVLRPNDDGSYELVGEAYVHGVMQGELFEKGEQIDFRYITLR